MGSWGAVRTRGAPVASKHRSTPSSPSFEKANKSLQIEHYLHLVRCTAEATKVAKYSLIIQSLPRMSQRSMWHHCSRLRPSRIHTLRARLQRRSARIPPRTIGTTKCRNFNPATAGLTFSTRDQTRILDTTRTRPLYWLKKLKATIRGIWILLTISWKESRVGIQNSRNLPKMPRRWMEWTIIHRMPKMRPLTPLTTFRDLK